MDLRELKVNEFTEILSSKEAVPGGGGASALVGALAACLGNMVGSLTVGKKKYADVEEELKERMAEIQKLRDALLSSINKDAEAFLPLSKAYSIDKADPDRERILEECLRDAADVPLKIYRICGEVIGLLQIFSEKGSRLAISDAATAAVFARAAMEGAAINVKVNTALMKDRDYAAMIDAQIENSIGTFKEKADEICRSVLFRISR